MSQQGGPQTLAGTLKRRRNLSEIVGQAFTFYGADWRGFATIGAATIPASVASTLIGDIVADAMIQAILLALLFLASIGLYATVEAAVISHLLALDGGRAEDELASFRGALDRLSDLLAATYRSFFIVIALVFTVVGIVFAFQRAIRWLFVPQAVMIDRQTSSTALAFSAKAVHGHWWRTFGRVIFIALIVGVLSGSITGLAASSPLLLYAFLSAIVGAFTSPYFSIALTLAYFDLRVRQADDLQAQTEAVDDGTDKDEPS